eukprot:scaffold39928_cov45-Attheya_sp.AAC.6
MWYRTGHDVECVLVRGWCPRAGLVRMFVYLLDRAGGAILDRGTRSETEREMSQKADQSRSEKKEEQTKESGPSFDLNTRLGSKLDPNMPLHTSAR